MSGWWCHIFHHLKKAISRGYIYIYSGYITNDDLLSGFSGFSHIYMLHTHTNTHTHIYIYIHMYICICIYIYTYLFNQTWDDDHDEY